MLVFLRRFYPRSEGTEGSPPDAVAWAAKKGGLLSPGMEGVVSGVAAAGKMGWLRAHWLWFVLVGGVGTALLVTTQRSRRAAAPIAFLFRGHA